MIKQVCENVGIYFQWKSLEEKLRTSFSFDYKLFKTVFEATYAAFKDAVCEEKIDRDTLMLFSGAQAFVDHYNRVCGVSKRHEAATLLTESLLSRFMAGGDEPLSGALILVKSSDGETPVSVSYDKLDTSLNALSRRL